MPHPAVFASANGRVPPCSPLESPSRRPRKHASASDSPSHNDIPRFFAPYPYLAHRARYCLHRNTHAPHPLPIVLFRPRRLAVLPFSTYTAFARLARAPLQPRRHLFSSSLLGFSFARWIARGHRFRHLVPPLGTSQNLYTPPRPPRCFHFLPPSGCTITYTRSTRQSSRISST